MVARTSKANLSSVNWGVQFSCVFLPFRFRFGAEIFIGGGVIITVDGTW